MDEADWHKIIAAYDQATLELQRTHENLRAEVGALQNYLANILMSVDRGVIAIDTRERITTFNPAAQRILHLEPVTVGENFPDLFPNENSPFPARAALDLLRRGLREERGFVDVEIIFSFADGKKNLACSVNLLCDATGKIIGAVETISDLTAMKILEEKAARQGRLAELGEMVAGVAHEIRNPLGGIELYASTLQRRLPENSREREIAGKIGEASVALNRIVTEMLAFTRQRAPLRQPCDPEQILRAAWEMAARESENKNITVDWQITTNGRKVALDRGQLIQAALNVILNAIQFSPVGGEIVIGAFFNHDLAEKTPEFLTFEFIDSGIGVSDESRSKIFNPFFTTRPDGTGLGLAIVHKIIDDHGGAVNVENRPPRGACFNFVLPVTASE